MITLLKHSAEGEYSTRVDADLGDLMKRLGKFEYPTNYWDWEIFRNRFEKMCKQEHIAEDRWSGIISEFLKGKARTHIEVMPQSHRT